LWQAQDPENYAPQFHELYHQTYPQFNDQSYSPRYQATPQSNSDVQAQMLKLLGEINQKLTQTINSHSESIVKIEAHEEEPSPIYWPPQQ
jgi:hypothetical protein